MSDVGPQEHRNITVEKLDDECLKDGSQQNSKFAPAYTNAKCKQNHENIMIQAKIQSKNTNVIIWFLFIHLLKPITALGLPI